MNMYVYFSFGQVSLIIMPCSFGPFGPCSAVYVYYVTKGESTGQGLGVEQVSQVQLIRTWETGSRSVPHVGCSDGERLALERCLLCHKTTRVSLTITSFILSSLSLSLCSSMC